ncbi:hypothetical protein NEUTE2DRAFT_123420 [Neurospora tetrasperma FGSC 2509]|nr:hypothetical protein NEUTE2DRAFT_123420 [Neurospora tetrasperma FGSC 2509]
MPTIAACARILVSGVKKTSLQVVTNRTSLQRGKSRGIDGGHSTLGTVTLNTRCVKDSLHLSSSSAFRSSLLFSLESSAFALPCVVHISRGFHSCLTRTKRPLGFRLSIISLVPCGCFPVPPATPKVVISVVTRSVFHYPPTGARRRHAELAAPIAIGPVPSSSWKKTRKDTAQLPVLLKSKYEYPLQRSEGPRIALPSPSSGIIPSPDLPDLATLPTQRAATLIR